MPKVEITHPEKLIYPADKITKQDIAEYYQLVSPVMLPLIKDRPLTLQRFPEGIESSLSFFQKNIPDYFPDWIDRVDVPNKTGGMTTYVVANRASTLAYLANQSALTLHGWLSRKQALDYPDRLIIDIDPGKTGFDEVKKVARDMKTVFETLGLTPFLMTTGSRGLHVVVPLDAKAPFDEVRAFAKQLMEWYTQNHPEHTTLEMHINKRKGRIFLDFLRNAFGQTGVAPYSLRPYKGAPVATPLHWKELDSSTLTSQTYTLRNIKKRLETVDNPWVAINRLKGSVRKAIQLLQKN